MNWMYLAASFVSGSLITIQGTINSGVGRKFNVLTMIVSVSLVQAIVAATLLMPRVNTGFIPMTKGWPVWLAGSMGVLIMTGITFSIPKIGSLTAFVLIIFGQLVISALIDNFGWFGVEVKPLSLLKLISIGLISLGVIILIKAE